MEYKSSDDSMIYVEKFESMLKTNEVYFFDSEEFIVIIHHYFDVGKDSLANQAIKLALTQHPTSFELKLLLAEQFINEDKTEEANLLLDNLKEIVSTNEQFFLLKATIYSKRLQHNKAISMLRKALKFTNDEEEILYLIGMEYLFLEEYHDAEKYFKTCLSIDIDDSQALNNLIFCYDIQDKHKEAELFLVDYIEHNPYCEIAWFQLGKQHFIQKKYNEALKAYDYAIVIDENFIGAIVEKGKVFEHLKKYEEAINCYLITLDLEDPSSSIYYKIGRCYEKLSDLNEAINYYGQAVYEDPQYEKGWIALIQLLIKEKHFVEALEAVNNALEMDDQNLKYLKNKDIILQNLEKEDL